MTDVVLTTVPQAALPVLAAEEDAVVSTVDEPVAVDEDIADDADESTGAEDVDAEESDDSEDPDATEGETNEEEGDGSDEAADDNETPVTDPAENQNTDEATDAGSDEEPTEETVEPAEEETDPDSEEKDADQIELNGSSIQAVTPSSAAITVEQYEKDGTPATGEGSATDKKLADDAVAEVTFIDGASADGKKALGGDRPVKFRLDVKDGWKEADLAVNYTIAKGGAVNEDKTGTVTAADGVYTIDTNVEAAGSGEAATPAGYSENITIKIVAASVISTVKLSAAAGENQGVYLTKADGTPDTEKAVDNSTGQKLTYAASTADVTLAVSGLAKKYHTIDVKTGSGKASTIKASGTKDVGTGAEKKTYSLFTFNPSELAGFETHTDNEITVTLGEGAEAHGLTLALDSGRTDKWTAAAMTLTESTTESYITVNSGGTGFDVSSITGGLNEDNYGKDGDGTGAKTRFLVFKVTPADAMKLKGEKPVTAVLADAEGNEVQTLDAAFVPAVTGQNSADAYYKIDLSKLTKTNFTGAMTLTVKAETEVDSVADGVHTISFAGDDLKNVTLGKKNGSSFDKLDTPYTAKMDSITFGVKPNTGYSLKKGTDYSANGTSKNEVVTVSYDKVYALKTTGEAPKNVTAKVTVTGEECAVTKETDYLTAEFKFKDDAKYMDADWKNGLPSGTTADQIATTDMTEEKAAYTKENVTVTVKTELASGLSGKVQIISRDADFEASGDGITKSFGNTYEISEEASLLTLKISSDTEPSVGYYMGESDEVTKNADVKEGESEGVYTAEIPVSELATDTETGEDGEEVTVISDTIIISKDSVSLTVDSTTDGDEDEDGFGGSVLVNGEEWDGETAFTKGMKANVTVSAPEGTELAGVTTKLGSGGEEEAVELEKDDKSSVTFSVTMTDNLTVNVALKSVYAAVVEVGSSKAKQDEEGVYVIPAGSENIKVSLFKGDASLAGNAADILYAKVYDGSEIAVTTATVATNTATIAKISEKDTGVLRVDLASADTKKVVASVQIRQEKAASKLNVKDAKNKAVTSVSLMADGPAAEFTVSAADGRLDYAESNIGLEVVAKADDAAAATPVTENDAVAAAYADGKLTITAKPAKEGKNAAAVIRFYDKAKRAAADTDTAATDKLCLMAGAITVNTTDPSVVGQTPVVKEAASGTKTLKVELSTTDKVVKPASANKVFYKVDITGEVSTGVEKTQYIEKIKWGKESQIAEIVVDTTEVNVNDDKTLGSAKDYSLKVELVQTTAQTAAPADWTAAVKAEETAKTLALGGKTAELKKISTRNPLYETKLKMKPASVTVYTGQTLEKVKKPQTQAQFDKKTGYTVVPYVQFVDTKTGVLKGTASNAADADGVASYSNWKATVDENGNVSIGYGGYAAAAKNLPKTMGLKVTAEYPEGAYAATAIVKITVANGIQYIDFVSGTQRSIYKQSGKPASLKLTPILNRGSKDAAPKKKTLTFAMGDASGRLPGDSGYNMNDEVAAKVKVNAKNGAVTVDKGYDVAKGGTFTVVAQAADYEGNNVVTGTVYVDVTGEPMALGEAVIVAYNSDSDAYDVVARDGGTVYAKDFYTYDETLDDLGYKYLQAVVLKPTAGTKRVYTDNDFVDGGMTYASGAKAALTVDNYGYLDFIKPNAKPVKLTVTAADGSKKNKAEMSVTVKGYEKLGLEMYDSNRTHYDARETAHTYDGVMNEQFELMPVAEVWNNWYFDCHSLGYANVNVTAKGAKITRKLSGGSMDIVMTAPTATITIVDKTDKAVKQTYTITQDPAADTRAKAPSIKQIGKLSAADVEKARTEGGVEVAFQVTNKNAEPANHARQYVFVTPDYTKTKYVNGYEYNRASQYFLNNRSSEIIQIDDNGRFSLDLNLLNLETFNIVPGSYTLIATVGTYDSGKFVPAAKGVSVKVTIPGKAAKNSLTVKGKYTLDASAMAPVDLASGKNIVTDYHWTLTNKADANSNYAMNKIDPKTGKANKFTEYFEVKKVGDSFTLGLKANLTKAQIEYITGQIKETAKAAKADCEGYVTVSSYKNNSNLPEMTKDMKITVSFKDAKYVAKTAEPSVYAGAEATVQIFETAKSTAPIALAGAVIVADEKNGGAALVNTTSGVEADGESLKVKLANAEGGKSYKVTFKILAANSAYASMDGATDLKKQAEDYGRTVTATIKVSGKDDKTKNKVAVTGKTFKVTSNDFVGVDNAYGITIPAKSAIEGTTISAAAVPATVKDKDYEGKDIVSATYEAVGGNVLLVVKRDKLIEANAAKSGKFKFNKSVDVPVTFTFADTAVAAETVTLKVTLPNPMTFEKTVEAAQKLEPVISGMEDDLLFADEEEMKAALEDRINAALSSAIPKDAQAVATRWISLADVEATDKTPAGYKTTVTVQKAAAKAEGDYEKEYTFTKAEAADVNANGLADAIGALTADSYKKLDNKYTAATLLEEVKTALAAQEPAVKIPVNLSLTVTRFSLKPATAAKDGSVNAVISIRDRNNMRSSKEVTLKLTIKALGDLADAATAVSAALNEKSGDTGVDYNAIISEALLAKPDKTTVEAALKTEIINAAKAAIRNDAITLETGKEFTKIEKAAGENGSDNPTTATTGKAMVDVDFKLPAGGTAGSVSFQLVLKQEGMKDLVVDCTGANAKKVTAKTFTKLEVSGQNTSKDEAEDLTINGEKVAIENVEGAVSLKFKAEVTGNQLTAKDKEVTFALVESGTAEEGKTLDDIKPVTTLPTGVTLTQNSDGTVTLSVGTNVAWGDSNKVTLYLRAQKKLTKLYASDTDANAIPVAGRTKVYTIELTKKAVEEPTS